MVGLAISTNYSDRQGFLSRLTVSAPPYELVIKQIILGRFDTKSSGMPVEVTLDLAEAHHEYSITASGTLRAHFHEESMDKDLSWLLSQVPVLHQAAAISSEQEVKDLVAVVLKALEK